MGFKCPLWIAENQVRFFYFPILIRLRGYDSCGMVGSSHWIPRENTLDRVTPELETQPDSGESRYKRINRKGIVAGSLAL